MTEERQVISVEIDGRDVSADKVICESCNTMWLDTEFDTTDPNLWKASCPHCGNQWTFEP